MNQPRLTDIPLWSRFEARALRILHRALALLAADAFDPDIDERELNRQLFRAIAEANHQIQNEDGGGLDRMPSYDGHQAPERVDVPRAVHEWKRPDFTWSWFDHQAGSGLEGCLEFAVECKRLGTADSRPDFDRAYVDDGVLRFVSDSHMYGLNGASGAMIGYVQCSDHDAILTNVSERSAHHGLPDLVAQPPAQEVFELRQLLARVFGATPFSLVHLWVDLRAA